MVVTTDNYIIQKRNSMNHVEFLFFSMERSLELLYSGVEVEIIIAIIDGPVSIYFGEIFRVHYDMPLDP